MSRNSDEATASLIYKLGRRIDALETRPRTPYPWGDLITELTRRIEALEALAASTARPEAPEEHTGHSTAVSGDVTATPPTFTSNTGIQENE